MLTFDTSSKALQFSGAGFEIRDWRVGVEAHGSLLDSSQAEVTILNNVPLQVKLFYPELGLEWTLQAECDEACGKVILRSTLENKSDRTIPLGKAFLLDTDNLLGLGADGKDVVCLPLDGEINDRVVWRLSDSKCPRSSKIKVQFFNPSQKKAMQVGFLTFRSANTEVAFESQPGRVCAWCDFAGWELDAGQSTPTETFILSVGEDPYTQLEAWADLASALCAPRRWEDAPIGWVGWAWVDPFTVECYEEVVLRNCAAIRRRLKGFGVSYVWTSLGNLTDVNPGDWLNWNREFFPNDPQTLAAKLREMGFKWGLWCAPFWMCSLLKEKMEEFRDALLKNADGSLLVVRPEWQYGAAGKMLRKDRPCMLALDPSHPKTLNYLKKVFGTYRSWGIRYYMLDFLHAGSGNISSFPYADHYDKRQIAGPEAYHRALRVIREAAGDDTYFLSSSGPSVHNAGIFDAIRTGNDFGEGRPLYPDSYFYPATYAINSGAHSTGPKRAVMNQASAYYTHRKLYLNDSGNVLTVDKPLPLSDAQIHATIHAMSGGPSMIGDDVDRMDEERLALIKKTLPRSKEVAFPVDLFDSPYPDYPKIFHREIKKSWGSFDVVAVYNFTEELLRLPIELPKLKLKSDTDYLVWEFWNSEYVGRITETLTAVVPPKSVRVYRLVEDAGRPVMLGTDMHVMMGEMEIDQCTWDLQTRTLSGRVIRPAGERGNVFLHAPEGLRVVNPRGYWIAKDARDNSLIIRVSLFFEDSTAGWDIRFVELQKELDMSELDLT